MLSPSTTPAMSRITIPLALLIAASACAAEPVAGSLPAPAPVARERSNYMAVGPAFERVWYNLNGVAAKSADGDPTFLSGVNFEYGRYFGKSSVGTHEVGVSAAMLGGTEETPAGVDVTLVEVPVTAYYNYNFRVGESTTLFVGPRAGLVLVNLGLDGGVYDNDSDSDVAFKYGIGLGLKQQFSPRFGMTLGMDYSRYTDTDFRVVASRFSISEMDSFKFYAAFAWTF